MSEPEGAEPEQLNQWWRTLEERRFKRELFLRLYPERPNEAAWCWMMVQRAWADKPEDC